MQVKNEHIVNNINDKLINLKNVINRKKVLENEKPNKIVNIVVNIVKNVKQLNH